MSKVLKRLTDAIEARAKRLKSEEPPVAVSTTIVPPVSPPGSPRATLVGLLGGSPGESVWFRYRYPALCFAVAAMVVVLIGNLAAPRLYKATAMIAVNDERINDEWDLLRDETRAVDLEEQTRSRAVLEPALQTVGLLLPPPRRRWFRPPVELTPEQQRLAVGAILRGFSKQLTVERPAHSNMLRITVAARRPELAADEANAIAEAFLGYHRKHAMDRAQRVITALDGEAKTIQNELEILTALREEVLVDDTLLQELVRQLAAADTRLSQISSRYREDSELVVQARREKDALESMLKSRITQRRNSLKELLAREQQRLHFLMEQEPEPATLDASIAQAKQRYQEIRQQRAQARFSLSVWQQPSDTFGRFTLMDPALPPLPTSRLAGTPLILLTAVLLGVLGFVLVPVILGLWESRAERAHAVIRRIHEGLALSPKDEPLDHSADDRASLHTGFPAS